MALAFLYIKTFISFWWALLPTGGLAGLDWYIANYWPAGAKRLAMIAPKIRHRIEVAILICVTLYAGFAAWNEEHTEKERIFALLQAERDKGRQGQVDQKFLMDRIDALNTQVAGLLRQKEDQDRQRLLTTEQKQKLNQIVCSSPHEFSGLIVRSEQSRESVIYSRDIMAVFRECGVNVDGPYITQIFQEEIKGIYVEVHNLDSVTKKSEYLHESLKNAGLNPGYISGIDQNEEPKLLISHK